MFRNRVESAPMQRVSAFLGITLVATAVTAGMLWIRIAAFPADVSTHTLPERVGIGIEHVQPLPLTMLVSRLNEHVRIELQHTGTESIRMSVPAQWQEAEIRGAKMSSVFSGVAFGVRTYQLPANVAIVFLAPALDGLDIFHPSRVPIHVMLKRIDSDAGFVDESSILIQESPSRVW